VDGDMAARAVSCARLLPRLHGRHRRATAQVFSSADLTNNGVILEYRLPLTSKRLDCAGSTDAGDLVGGGSSRIGARSAEANPRRMRWTSSFGR
jgi:hypothetical protein